MGTQSQAIAPQRCKECPFFEIVHSPLGVSFFCRFYKKGALRLNGKKFDFCKVEKIEIYESKSNDDLN
ncbi:MAG: hypothetical protein ACTSQP_24340 [Promethearchaeota archaeon]